MDRFLFLVAIRPLFGTYEEDVSVNVTTTTSERKRRRAVDEEHEMQGNEGWNASENEVNGQEQNQNRAQADEGETQGMKKRHRPGRFTTPNQMSQFGMGPGMKLGMPVSCGVFARMWRHFIMIDCGSIKSDQIITWRGYSFIIATRCDEFLAQKYLINGICMSDQFFRLFLIEKDDEPMSK